MPESFQDEVVVERAFSEDELGLAKTLIEAKTMEDFDLGRYKDAYVEKLTELIEGKEIVTAPVPEEPQILDLGLSDFPELTMPSRLGLIAERWTRWVRAGLS